MDDVYQAPGQPRLRIALHYGEVQTRQRDGDLAAVIVGGDADPVRRAGRAGRRAGADLGHRGIPPRAIAAALAVADDARARAGRRRSLQREEAGSAEPDLWVRADSASSSDGEAHRAFARRFANIRES